MGIYIKGMKMPKSCGDCLMKVQYASGITWCEPMVKILATDHKSVCCYGRPDFCPLDEIPEPHGRLIDASYKVDMPFYDDEYEEYSIRTVTVEELLMMADDEVPTVIEAEGSEDK